MNVNQTYVDELTSLFKKKSFYEIYKFIKKNKLNYESLELLLINLVNFGTVEDYKFLYDNFYDFKIEGCDNLPFILLSQNKTDIFKWYYGLFNTNVKELKKEFNLAEDELNFLVSKKIKQNKITSNINDEILNKILELSFTDDIDNINNNIIKLKQSSYTFKPKFIKVLYKNIISNGSFKMFKCINNSLDLTNTHLNSFGMKCFDKLLRKCLKSNNNELFKYLIQNYSHKIKYVSLFLCCCSLGNIKLFFWFLDKQYVSNLDMKKFINQIFIKICSGGNIDLMNYLLNFIRENQDLEKNLNYKHIVSGFNYIILKGNFELLKWLNINEKSLVDNYFKNNFLEFINNRFNNVDKILTIEKNKKLTEYLAYELEVIPKQLITTYISKEYKEEKKEKNNFMSYYS